MNEIFVYNIDMSTNIPNMEEESKDGGAAFFGLVSKKKNLGDKYFGKWEISTI